TCHSTERGELTCHNDFSIGLQGQRMDRPIRAGIKGRIERPVGVEPSNVTSWQQSYHGELPADEYLSVGLDGYRVHRSIGHRVKGEIQRAAGIEPADPVAGLVSQPREEPTHHNRSV